MEIQVNNILGWALRSLSFCSSLGYFLYFAITSIQYFMEAQKEVEQTTKEVQDAARELQESQKELDNTVKYGCTNPTKMGELVMCP
jgi:predicted transcriptional regulator